ncbi:hypothetical protein KR054_002944, partial [Drosophila jambulina]
PTVVQINLKRSSHASANLGVLLREKDIDIGLIQEPWTRDGQISGMAIKGYTTLYTNSTGRPRAGIIIKNNLNALLYPNLSNLDLAVARFKAADGTAILIASRYMAHDEPAPPEAFIRVMQWAEETKTTLILGRFIARRGKCATIYSDNGTNFVGAARKLDGQLAKAIKENSAVASQLGKEGIEWHFIPPAGPHFGDRWKLIQKMKRDFWIKWKKDYLHTLQQRYKWKKNVPNKDKGQVVLVKDENCHPSRWPLGKVEE